MALHLGRFVGGALRPGHVEGQGPPTGRAALPGPGHRLLGHPVRHRLRPLAYPDRGHPGPRVGRAGPHGAAAPRHLGGQLALPHLRTPKPRDERPEHQPVAAGPDLVRRLVAQRPPRPSGVGPSRCPAGPARPLGLAHQALRAPGTGLPGAVARPGHRTVNLSDQPAPARVPSAVASRLRWLNPVTSASVWPPSISTPASTGGGAPSTWWPPAGRSTPTCSCSRSAGRRTRGPERPRRWVRHWATTSSSTSSPGAGGAGPTRGPTTVG